MTTLRILVTDDEVGMRLGVTRALASCRIHVPEVNEDVDFRVEAAESGEQAMEVLRREPPDILLLDHKMPGMSGLDVLDQLPGLGVDTLAIMITAYASIETAVQATRRGAYDFLAKPFTPAELRATIQKSATHVILAREARRLAEERRQVRFEFVRVLGHELKAPLSAVSGYLIAMRERHLGDALGDYDGMLDRCLARLDGMHRLIRDLLDLTRIESGQKQRALADVDVAAAARAAIEGAQAAAAPRGIALALGAGAPVTMRADAGELEMILNNLVSNAVKYNKDGGRVDVDVARAGARVTVSVRDTGIGMSAPDVARLFGEFVRIRSSDTAHIEGSGLGLSIVRKLVQLYGGEVRVDSAPGEGTTVTVELDAEAPVPVPPASPSPAGTR